MTSARLVAIATFLGASLAACGAGCSSGDGATPPARDGGRTRRVIEPPPGTVRPLPPHAIDAGGVGPYRLGVSQAQALAALPPAIPRIAIFDVDSLLDVSVIRAEDDAVLVGNRPAEAISFIAVLTPAIAKTAGGLAVGSRRAALAELGEPVADPRTARDPRVMVMSGLPGASFLMEGDRVAAIMLQPVASEAPVQVPPPPPAFVPPMPADAGTSDDAGAGAATGAGCTGKLPAPATEVVSVAAIKGPAQVHAACLTAAGREALVVSGDTITIVEGDGSRARRVTSTELRGLVWAAPLRSEPDRDDVVAVVERRTAAELVVSLVALRLEGGRLIRLADEPAFTLTATSAEWIGARVNDVRMLIQVEVRPDRYQVGGTLIHAAALAVRDVAPLVPVSITRRRRVSSESSGAPPVDAGAPDGTSATRGDAGTQRDASSKPDAGP